ncbi:MAG: RHS repeat-associated core domain-containing protein [Gammaproteobacteria bacterium]
MLLCISLTDAARGAEVYATPTFGPLLTGGTYNNESLCVSDSTTEAALAPVLRWFTERESDGGVWSQVSCTEPASRNATRMEEDTLNLCPAQPHYVEVRVARCLTRVTYPNGVVNPGLTFPFERHMECPAGYYYDTAATGGNTVCRVRIDDTCRIGDPVSPLTGALFEEETDYSSGGAFPLEFRRYYFGDGHYSPGAIKVGQRTAGITSTWGHTYGTRVFVDPMALGISTTVVRPDGSAWHFDANGNEIQNRSGTGAASRIQHLADGTWTLTLADSDVERFNSGGQLTSITKRSGFVTRVSYSAQRITVADQFGRVLSLDFDSDGRLSTLTDPAGGIVSYAYEGLQSAGTEKLVSVTYPDARTRSYTYSTIKRRELLASIIDENGRTFATYVYDAQGRVTSSEHAGGAGRHTYAYTVSWSSDQNPITAVTDPLGQSRSYTMSSSTGAYRVKRVTGGPCAGCGKVASTTYDQNGNPRTQTDFNGVMTRQVFDLTRNLETSRTEASGTTSERTISTAWHPTYRLPALITEPGRTTSFTYDGSGNALTKTITDTSVAPGVARAWTSTYNIAGQVLTEDGPRTDVADVTTYTYYNCTTGYQCGQLSSVTNAMGQATTFGTYNAHGQPLTITDPNSVVTTLTYDARQRVISQQMGVERTVFTYWPTGLLKRVTLPDNSFLEHSYDDAHRLTQTADGEGNRVAYTLDAVGNHTAEETYDPSGALSRRRTQVFDTLSRLWKQIGAGATEAVTTTFTYDDNGNQTAVDEPLSRSTLSQYDPLNRLTAITDAAGGVTEFGYDASDNLTSVTDVRALQTLYEYTGFGDLRTQVSPDTGTTRRTYDSGGNLRTTADSRSIAGAYTYDALNRLTSISYADQAVSFSYDAGANGVGRLTGAADASHSLAWTYDALGRVTSRAQTLGGVTRRIGYGYTNGDMTSILTPSGQTVTYAYAQGRITGISVNGTALLNGVLYEPFGAIRQWTWGNGSASVRTFDQDGRITQIESAGDQYRYSYDDASRIVGIESSDPASGSWGYFYDGLDRLGAAFTTEYSESWTYDAVGNRLNESSTRPDPWSSDLEVSATSNHLTSVSGSRSDSYGYDNAGNVTSQSNSGRPVSLSGTTTTTYQYNALSQRIGKTVGAAGTHFMYDEAGHLLGEYTSGGLLIQENVWLGDIPVATLRPGPGGGVDAYYVHTDHQSTPRKITRPADNVARWRWDPKPFGDTLPDENPQNAGSFAYNLRFAGQYYDAESGLSYNYLRNYDPSTGRYAESDPTGLRGGLNTYLYTNGSPLMLSDPEGRSPLAIPYVAGVAVGAAIGAYVLAKYGESIGGLIYDKLHDDDATPSAAQNDEVRQKDYLRAKNFCDTPPPPGGNECSTPSAQIDHAEQCIALYEQWDAKWLPGRHAPKIQTWRNRLGTLKTTHRLKCTNKCP